jgi:hypothetical protein
MGTDNLFHKRKARQANALRRRRASREPYAKVLIVCEGEKTEPNYFHGLKEYYRLSSANVEIGGNIGSAPSNLYDYARQRYREEKDNGDPYDHVYCVFDRDTHDSYLQTVQDIAHSKPKDVFQAITSIPCFEYWLLLHFEYSTKPYNPLPGYSACHQVFDDLKKFMLDYAKGQDEIFMKLQPQLEFAKANAERALKTANCNSTDNPSTRVHELVDFLQHLKE